MVRTRKLLRYAHSQKLTNIDLQRLYKLASKTETGFKALKNRFEEYVHSEGLKNLENTKIYAETVLKLYTKHRTVVKTVFYNDAEFYRAIDLATVRYLNGNSNYFQIF